MTLERRTPLKRTGINRGTSQLRRTRIKPISDRARREQPAVDAFRAAVRARSGGFCELSTPACPPGRHEGHHAHHVRMRSQGGGHDPDNGLWLCWAAHRYVHANPMRSYENGWLLRGTA